MAEHKIVQAKPDKIVRAKPDKIVRAKPDKIIIIGAGGHARVLIGVLRRQGVAVAGCVDINPALHGTAIDGVPVIGGDEALFALAPEAVRLVSGQGNVPGQGVSGLARRRGVFERFGQRGYRFMSVVSPDTFISDTAVLDEGCQVITGAIIHPGARIGVNAIVNTGAQVDHDCVIGAHSHVAPGTVLCGGVTVGEESHVGAGAVVIPLIKIGARAVVGAGAVVVDHVPDGATVLGSPARAR